MTGQLPPFTTADFKWKPIWKILVATDFPVRKVLKDEEFRTWKKVRCMVALMISKKNLVMSWRIFFAWGHSETTWIRWGWYVVKNAFFCPGLGPVCPEFWYGRWQNSGEKKNTPAENNFNTCMILSKQKFGRIIQRLILLCYCQEAKKKMSKSKPADIPFQ